MTKPHKSRKLTGKGKTTPNPEKHAGEAVMSSAALYRATGHGQSAIAEMKATGVIAPNGKNQWPIIETLGAMYRRLRERNAGDEDRFRKNKAEADEAELRAMEAAGLTIPLADAKQFWSDARIELKQEVLRADFLTPMQKTKLLAKFAALKTRQPEDEK